MSKEKHKQDAERLIELFKKYANPQTPESYDYNSKEHLKNAKACAAICCQEKLKLLQKLKEDFGFASDLDSYAADQQKVLEHIKQQ